MAYKRDTAGISVDLLFLDRVFIKHAAKRFPVQVIPRIRPAVVCIQRRCSNNLGSGFLTFKLSLQHDVDAFGSFGSVVVSPDLVDCYFRTVVAVGILSEVKNLIGIIDGIKVAAVYVGRKQVFVQSVLQSVDGKGNCTGGGTIGRRLVMPLDLQVDFLSAVQGMGVRIVFELSNARNRNIFYVFPCAAGDSFLDDVIEILILCLAGTVGICEPKVSFCFFDLRENKAASRFAAGCFLSGSGLGIKLTIRFAFQFLQFKGEDNAVVGISAGVVIDQFLLDFQACFTAGLVRPLMAIEVPLGRGCHLSACKQPTGAGAAADIHIGLRCKEQTGCFFQVQCGRIIRIEEDMAEDQLVYVLISLRTAAGIVCSVRNSIYGFILDKLTIRIFIIGRNREFVDCYIRSRYIKDQSLPCQLINMPARCGSCRIRAVDVYSSVVRIISCINNILIGSQDHAGFSVSPLQILGLCFPGVNHRIDVLFDLFRSIFSDNMYFIICSIPDLPCFTFGGKQVDIDVCILGEPEHIINMGNSNRNGCTSGAADIHILAIIEIVDSKVRFSMNACVVFFRNDTVFYCLCLNLIRISKTQHVSRSNQSFGLICTGSEGDEIASFAFLGCPHFHTKDTSFNCIIVLVRVKLSRLYFLRIATIIVLPFDQEDINIPTGIIRCATLRPFTINGIDNRVGSGKRDSKTYIIPWSKVMLQYNEIIPVLGQISPFRESDCYIMFSRRRSCRGRLLGTDCDQTGTVIVCRISNCNRLSIQGILYSIIKNNGSPTIDRAHFIISSSFDNDINAIRWRCETDHLTIIDTVQSP